MALSKMDTPENAKRGTWSRPISISPPPKRRRASNPSNHADGDLANLRVDTSTSEVYADEVPELVAMAAKSPNPRIVSSPVQLNFIEQLPSTSNVDTVSLGSILGDVMIRECWLFNYLFDLEFVM